MRSSRATRTIKIQLSWSKNAQHVLDIVGNGLDVNAPIKSTRANGKCYSRFPLELARTKEVAQALIDCGADVTKQIIRINEYGSVVEKYQETFLHSTRHSEVLKVLLDQNKFDIDVLSSYGNTPLMNAAHRGDVDSVRLLLERGANPQKALFHCRNADIMKLLIEFGVDVKTTTDLHIRKTLLQYQISLLECAKSDGLEKKMLELCRFLVSAGASTEGVSLSLLA